MNTRDENLLENFEKGIAPADGFHHRDHILVAFLYLRRYSAAEALARFAAALKNFAHANAKPHLYHETITWAYIVLINERMARSDSASSSTSDGRPAVDTVTWETFERQHPDLFAPKNAAIARLYRPETLASDFAKKAFVLPDRGSPQAADR